MSRTQKFAPLALPELPTETINRILGTELDPGAAYMSAQAHRHAAEKHPDDYAICVRHLSETIRNPGYVGQAPHHSENFELIRRVPGLQDAAMLVAVGIVRDNLGRYRVRSMYLIDQGEFDRKREKGTIKPALK